MQAFLFDMFFCTLTGVLKFSVGAVGEYHSMCIKGLHHIGEVTVNFCLIFSLMQSILKAKFLFESMGL